MCLHAGPLASVYPQLEMWWSFDHQGSPIEKQTSGKTFMLSSSWRTGVTRVRACWNELAPLHHVTTWCLLVTSVLQFTTWEDYSKVCEKRDSRSGIWLFIFPPAELRKYIYFLFPFLLVDFLVYDTPLKCILITYSSITLFWLGVEDKSNITLVSRFLLHFLTSGGINLRNYINTILVL